MDHDERLLGCALPWHPPELPIGGAVGAGVWGGGGSGSEVTPLPLFLPPALVVSSTSSAKDKVYRKGCGSHQHERQRRHKNGAGLFFFGFHIEKFRVCVYACSTPL